MATPSVKQTVLLVDDERNLVRVLEARLRREGYSTLAAYDGAEALTVLRRYAVHAVVLDVQMSGLSGQETLKAIHAIRPELPVVLMSAYGKPEGLTDFVTYLEKPFNLDMMVTAVANALKTRRVVGSSSSAFALFTPGQVLRMVVPDAGGLCYGTGAVQDETEDTLVVTAPVKDGRAVIPSAGAAVRVTLTGRDALYSFNSRVQDAMPAPRSGLVLSKPDIIERHQRRAATRVPVAWPVRLEVLPPGDKGKPFKLSTSWESVNVSQTGMMVSGEATVPANSSVLFSVAIPGAGDPLQGRARVVWDATTPNERFTMGLEFVGLEDEARALLQANIAA
ncbi:MAG TPA: response regulator [Armatimonadota bacterium]